MRGHRSINLVYAVWGISACKLVLEQRGFVLDQPQSGIRTLYFHPESYVVPTIVAEERSR